ncbi:MAG TPA: hypothetical protein VM261_36815 [Kofleriaceae bacterium]|nr:hypothetical protein [Kofleriaceae bacterium]
MSPTIMSALTVLASRSKRLRPYLPFLSIVPALLGAYQLYKRHQASAAPARS